MRQTPGKPPLLFSQEVVLTSKRGCGRVENRASEVSNGGECSKDGWVQIGGVSILSRVFLASFASSLSISVGSTLSGRLKISLGKEKLSSSDLTSYCIYLSSSRCSVSYGQLSEIAGRL